MEVLPESEAGAFAGEAPGHPALKFNTYTPAATALSIGVKILGAHGAPRQVAPERKRAD